jgi:ribosomal protein L30/L7E
MSIVTVEPIGQSPEVLEFIKGTFNTIAAFIKLLVVSVGAFEVSFGWDNWFYFAPKQGAPKLFADIRKKTTAEQEQAVVDLRRQRLPFWKIAAQTGLSRATAARIGKVQGLSLLSALEAKAPIIRYERKAPGDMIHIDIKKLGRIEGIGHRITGNRFGQSAPRSRKTGGHGWEYLHLAVDDHSRVAYSEILPDETRRSCLRFLFNALRFFKRHGIKVHRVMTNNGVSFRSHRYMKALRLLKIKHCRTKPYTPKTNGKAERFVQTSLREWAYARPYSSSQDRADDLLPFLTHYNYHRPHFGLHGKTPISRLPVNNLLRHDN